MFKPDAKWEFSWSSDDHIDLSGRNKLNSDESQRLWWWIKIKILEKIKISKFWNKICSTVF
jgi:hypothetical protein